MTAFLRALPSYLLAIAIGAGSAIFLVLELAK